MLKLIFLTPLSPTRLNSIYTVTVALVLGVVLVVPAGAQTVEVQNGTTVEVQNGGVIDLEDGTMDFGDVGATAGLDEQGGGHVTGGQLEAIRTLSSPSEADPAGLGAELSASADLGDVTVIRGHDIQMGNNNESIARYYDIEPSGTNSSLNATLTFHYVDAELNNRTESELELFKSPDEGSNWSEEGYDSRDASANTVTLGGIASFSRWTLGGEPNPLPVEMTRFEAQVERGRARLTWQTASEANNAGFAVQRRVADASAPGVRTTDERTSWQRVDFVDSKAADGSSDEALTYQFTDAELPYAADSLSYRLRQVDLDGTESVTEPVTVERSTPELELLGTFPNPARSRATVRYALPEKKDVALRLYDMLGRQVRTVVQTEQEGRHEQILDTAGLSSGVYFLRLQAGGQTRTQKLTVVR